MGQTFISFDALVLWKTKFILVSAPWEHSTGIMIPTPSLNTQKMNPQHGQQVYIITVNDSAKLRILRAVAIQTFRSKWGNSATRSLFSLSFLFSVNWGPKCSLYRERHHSGRLWERLSVSSINLLYQLHQLSNVMHDLQSPQSVKHCSSSFLGEFLSCFF